VRENPSRDRHGGLFLDPASDSPPQRESADDEPVHGGDQHALVDAAGGSGSTGRGRRLRRDRLEGREVLRGYGRRVGSGSSRGPSEQANENQSE
jgi:hypothetical protein